MRGLYRFSDHFGINKPQSQLDFVDIPLDTDIRLFVDPYALHVSPVDWLRTCGDLVVNYFDVLIQMLKGNCEAEALGLLANLHEPNETRLEMSAGKPSGRGWGRVQARQLYDQLRRSKAMRSGRLKDLGDFELFMPGIGSDKISDLAVNVIRGELAAYTKDQCDLYDVATENVPAGTFWNPDDKRWESHYAELPTYLDQGVILVPKYAVRRRLAVDYVEFYDKYVLSFLVAEHEHPGDALAHTLKNGDPKVYKKDLRAVYTRSKDNVFEFSQKHPIILQNYKRSLPRKVADPITNDSIEATQVSARRSDPNAAARDLASIPPGLKDAPKYHSLMIGVLTDIFYPELTRPKKEQSADEGRKRIDIFFTNSSTGGFFSRLVQKHNYLAPYISVECKNYSSDPENPEFDQLQGRLNRKRGFVGIMVCRTIQDRDLMLKRCRDVVNNDDNRLILVLDDRDITALLELVAAQDKNIISEYMEDKLKEILA